MAPKMFDTDELMSMFGFVDEEDREKWDRMEKAKQDRGRTGEKSLATKVSEGGLGMAEQVVTSKMRAAHVGKNDKARESSMRRTTRWEKTDFVEDEKDGMPGF